jgi:hypothetical protein
VEGGIVAVYIQDTWLWGKCVPDGVNVLCIFADLCWAHGFLSRDT